MKNNAQLINQTSGEFEYYTPSFIVEAARRVMGSIDLDPASSEQANRSVKAKVYFDIKDDGLSKPWFGNVWMNHPFGRKENPLWINKAMETDEEQLMCITYACTSERWFRPLTTGLQCYLCPRTDYYLPDGSKKKGVTKGSVVTYYGINIKGFIEEFSKYGWIKR